MATRNKQADERRSGAFRGHVVVPVFSDEGTDDLRMLVSLVGGVTPAARLMEEDPEDVAGWTRTGLPRHLWSTVRRLRHTQREQDIPQNPNAEWASAFSYAR